MITDALARPIPPSTGSRASATPKLIALVITLALASPGLAQTSEPPYPGASPHTADEEFYKSQAIAAGRRSGVRPEAVLTTFDENSFVTAAAFDSVFARLRALAVEAQRNRTKDPESLTRSFLRSLTEQELTALAQSVGSGLPGGEYRRAFLAGLNTSRPREVQHGLIALARPGGGVLLYYELHRPYFDVTSLQWVDETRIRVIRFPQGL